MDSLSFLFTLCLTQFLKARDFGWIHLQQNSYSHHICSMEFVRLKGQKTHRQKWWLCCSLFFISVNFCFSFVLNSLAYITIPKNNGKIKINWNKKLTTTAIHNSNHNSVYEVNLFSPDSSHMFHLRHAIACKFRKGNHLRQECDNKQYITNY